MHAGQALSCWTCDSSRPVAWLDAGLSPRSPSCELHPVATGGSRPGSPASRRGGGGAPCHPPLLQKVKPDWGWQPAEHPGPTSPLSSPVTGHITALASSPECWPCVPPSELRRQDPGLPVRVRRHWKGGGHLHPGPAATSAGQAGLEALCSASAVGSLSPVWGMSCWRHHMIHHQAALRRPAGPHPAQHLQAARKHM